MDHVKSNLVNLPRQRHSKWDDVWLANRIALLLSAYRKDDYENPTMFVEQLRVNLDKYSREIVEHVTDPTTGVQTKHQWPPSIAEVVKACEARASELATRNRYTAMGTYVPRARKPGPPPGQSYEEMFAKHGRPFGPFEVGRQLPYK